LHDIPLLFDSVILPHVISPNDFVHPSPATRFKSFLVFQIYFLKCSGFSATQSYAPNVALY